MNPVLTLLERGRLMCRKAAAAVDRPVSARPEWHCGRHTAFRANGFEARPGSRGRLPGCLSRATAIATPLGFVLKAFFGIKLLIANGKQKRPSALFAGEILVFHGSGASGKVAGELYATCVGKFPRLPNSQGYPSGRRNPIAGSESRGGMSSSKAAAKAAS